MKDAFYNLCENLVNKDCCFIRLGYGSKLHIGIGEKLYYENPKLEGKYHGEWDLFSRTYAWKISRDNSILCGNDDDPEFINQILRNLKLGSISHIEKRNAVDVSLHFSYGIVIDFFCCSTDDNQMMIMNNRERAYEFTIDGIYEVDINEHFDTLAEIESVLKELSEKCDKRWNELVPKNNSDEKCDDCFFFRGISGYFYFWDYGICSNEESPYDGKLVGFKSGCQFHKFLKDII